MPYRRRTYRRRRPAARRGYGIRDYAAMAASAYSGVKYLKSLVNVEKHPLLTNATVTPDNVTGTFSCLNLVAQGDTNTSRTGNSILMRSVNINIRYSINASASHSTIRTILFWDKEANGSTPIISDILATASALGNYNHDEASRFQVLYDKPLVLSNTGTQELYKRIYKRLQRHTHFDGTTAAVADIVDYSLWLFFVSDEATNVPAINFNSQVLFIDN